MKTFSLKELKKDTLYRCVLSDRVVLVYSIEEKQAKAMGVSYPYTSVQAWAYNPITAQYDSIWISDNQLTAF